MSNQFLRNNPKDIVSNISKVAINNFETSYTFKSSYSTRQSSQSVTRSMLTTSTITTTNTPIDKFEFPSNAFCWCLVEDFMTTPVGTEILILIPEKHSK